MHVALCFATKSRKLPIFDNFRQEKGGVLVITTRLLNHLHGNWPPPRYTLLLYQWNTVASLNEYEERIQSNGKVFGTEIIKLPYSTHIIQTIYAQLTWAWKIVSMARKYHNHKPQTIPLHCEEEPLNHHKTQGRQIKQSNQLSLPHQDDCNARMDIK